MPCWGASNEYSKHKFLWRTGENYPTIITKYSSLTIPFSIPKVGKPELHFLCSAHCLMVLYICEKFHNNISNGYQLTERTWVQGRNGYVQCSKGNNSKQEIQFMYFASCLIGLYICVKFSENKSGHKYIVEITIFNINYSRLSLSRIPKDSLKYFEISVLRHIRFAELRKK